MEDKENYFKLDISRLIKDSKEPKRNKEGVLMISKEDEEGREWYYKG